MFLIYIFKGQESYSVKVMLKNNIITFSIGKCERNKYGQHLEENHSGARGRNFQLADHDRHP